MCWTDFGTTVLSCVKIITGDTEWAAYYQPMHFISSVHSVVLIPYLVLMTFGVFNDTTGTFCGICQPPKIAKILRWQSLKLQLKGQRCHQG